MRPSILALIAAVLLVAPAALAQPAIHGCRSENLDTVRCGTPGAMPAGWTPSARQIMDHQASTLPSPSPDEVLDLICVIGGLFALIALMPTFDGWRAGDWDKQEGDDEERE